jgi:hypothetical protein
MHAHPLAPGYLTQRREIEMRATQARKWDAVPLSKLT